MGYNNPPVPFAYLNVTNLAVTGDVSPEAGVATQVTVKFEFPLLFHNIFLKPQNWPYTVKVYAEGYGGYVPGEGMPQERAWTKSGTCNQTGPNANQYSIDVPITLLREGVYSASAIVELDNGAGIIMGFADTPVQINVWSSQ